MAAASQAGSTAALASLKFDPEEQYEKLDVVGEGTYGLVYKTKRRPIFADPKVYALKRTKGLTSTDGLPISVTREIALLTELNHANIIKVKDIYFSAQGQPDVWLVFEYAEHDVWTILNHHRQQNKGAMPAESMQKSMTCQVLRGIDYLHNSWVLHRDLKPANILIMGQGPEYGRVKIGDLGMARLFQSPLKPLTEVDSVVVTYWYRAPELLLGAKHYTKAVDNWAVGCIMAEMMLQKPLFWIRNEDASKEVYHKEQLVAIFSICGRPSPRAPMAQGLPTRLEWQNMDALPYYARLLEDLRPPTSLDGKKLEQLIPRLSPFKLSLLHGLLRFDPQQRLTASAALEMPYFTDGEPFNPENVFHGVPNTYPPRAIIDERKDKKKEPARSDSQRSSASKRTRMDK